MGCFAGRRVPVLRPVEMRLRIRFATSKEMPIAPK